MGKHKGVIGTIFAKYSTPKCGTPILVLVHIAYLVDYMYDTLDEASQGLLANECASEHSGCCDHIKYLCCCNAHSLPKHDSICIYKK